MIYWRRIAHHMGRKISELTRVWRKSTERQVVQRRRDKSSIWIAVIWTVIDAKNACLTVEEGVWAWIAGTFYDILSENDVSPVGLNDSADHVSGKVWNRI